MPGLIDQADKQNSNIVRAASRVGGFHQMLAGQMWV
jgi:hypothetical protein